MSKWPIELSAQDGCFSLGADSTDGLELAIFVNILLLLWTMFGPSKLYRNHAFVVE